MLPAVLQNKPKATPKAQRLITNEQEHQSGTNSKKSNRITRVSEGDRCVYFFEH